MRLGANRVAPRELASASFVQQNYDAARPFYIRAVQADSSDKFSQGFLGCSLVRLGRVDEGTRRITRAGRCVEQLRAAAWRDPARCAAGREAHEPGMQAVPPSGARPPRTRRIAIAFDHVGKR